MFTENPKKMIGECADDGRVILTTLPLVLKAKARDFAEIRSI